MNSTNTDCLRAARDMAEMLWRSRAGSRLSAILHGAQVVGCNADDQSLLHALAAVIVAQPDGPPVYVHWISDSASTYFMPPEGGSMLYVMRPGRLPGILQGLNSQPAGCRYLVEANAEIALLYRY
jgi:hypothetical protein